jgi:hypothetical protein
VVAEVLGNVLAGAVVVTAALGALAFGVVAVWALLRGLVD